MLFPETKDFTITDSAKDQALKVLEEAAEFVEAVKLYIQADSLESEINAFNSAYMFELAAQHEFCDILQAMGNFAQLIGWGPEQIEEAYSSIVKGNEARGRYE